MIKLLPISCWIYSSLMIKQFDKTFSQESVSVQSLPIFNRFALTPHCLEQTNLVQKLKSYL